MAGMDVGGSAMQALHHPTLAGVFSLLLIAYSVCGLDQLSGMRFSVATGEGPAAGAMASGRDPTSRAFQLVAATQVGLAGRP